MPAKVRAALGEGGAVPVGSGRRRRSNRAGRATPTTTATITQPRWRFGVEHAGLPRAGVEGRVPTRRRGPLSRRTSQRPRRRGRPNQRLSMVALRRGVARSCSSTATARAGVCRGAAAAPVGRADALVVDHHDVAVGHGDDPHAGRPGSSCGGPRSARNTLDDLAGLGRTRHRWRSLARTPNSTPPMMADRRCHGPDRARAATVVPPAKTARRALVPWVGRSVRSGAAPAGARGHAAQGRWLARPTVGPDLT